MVRLAPELETIDAGTTGASHNQPAPIGHPFIAVSNQRFSQLCLVLVAMQDKVKPELLETALDQTGIPYCGEIQPDLTTFWFFRVSRG